MSLFQKIKDRGEIDVKVPRRIAAHVVYRTDDLEPFICLQVDFKRRTVNIGLCDEDAEAVIDLLSKVRGHLRETVGEPA